MILLLMDLQDVGYANSISTAILENLYCCNSFCLGKQKYKSSYKNSNTSSICLECQRKRR